MADPAKTAKRLAQLTAGAYVAGKSFGLESRVENMLPQQVKTLLEKNKETYPVVVFLIGFGLRVWGNLPKELQYLPDGIATVALTRIIDRIIVHRL